MTSGKGKEKVSDAGGKGKGKRTWNGGGGGDDDKTGRKRKNRGVLQFFDDAAYEVEDDDSSDNDSMFDYDSFEDELNPNSNDKTGKTGRGKVPYLPFIPKEEVMSDDELEKMLEARYKPGAGFVTHAEDRYEGKRSFEKDMPVPSAKDPTIWKVKCVAGRERFSTFCLMQKFADLNSLGTKLKIISAFAPDHAKGFIYVEADKQNDIYEACKGLSSIFSSRVAPVPQNEISHLLTVRSKSSAISEGMWARVKSGRYKGDLAQVMAVNEARTKVTAKLIPRIDLKALAEKFGGGIAAKRTAIPAQRLISSRELDEFRPLIHHRRDRDTNEMFEILDGMMLKDGYLYKKIPIDSLSIWGVMPTEDELLKFEPSKKNESTDDQWVSQLFGEKKKKKQQVEEVKNDKVGGKSKDGSTSSSSGYNFEVPDLVFWGRKNFGVVIGFEKDDYVKVMKEGSEGLPFVVTVKQNELKSALFDKKLFTVSDRNSKIISINDSVEVLEGPLKDRQGIVKKIYKGLLFVFDEKVEENNGYFCIKGQLCEKLNHSSDKANEKGGEPEPSGFADFMSSPKSPLSPKKPWQEKDDQSNFKLQDDSMYSVGQSLRIRVGPLKGYLCRVLAIRRSELTVKLDSKPKILTVKCEHLAEVRGRTSAISQGEGFEAVKPFDFLGSTERDSWSVPGSAGPMDEDTPKETSGWGQGSSSTTESSGAWGAAKKADAEPSGTWGAKNADAEPSGTWGAAKNVDAEPSGAWGAKKADTEEPSGAWGAKKADAEPSGAWGAKKADVAEPSGAWGAKKADVDEPFGAWGVKKADVEEPFGAWGVKKAETVPSVAWGAKKADVEEPSGTWGSKKADADAPSGAWGAKKADLEEPSGAWGAKKADLEETSGAWGAKKADLEESSGAWGAKKADLEESSGAWGAKKADVEESSGAWGAKKADVEEPSGAWGAKKANTEEPSGAWGQGAKNVDGGSSTGWGKAPLSNENKSSWGSGTTSVDGGSSAGWGQSKWKSDSGGNGDSSWSSKSNWNSDGGSNEDNSFSDRGGGGNWRGGRGGRGGFRGRDGSDRGGYGGRGGSDLGGYGGRDGSDRGGYGGRGGRGRFGDNDREGGGFRGGFRGGRGGRGGGDWKNAGGDSNEDNKPYSWNKGSNNDSWKSSGNEGGSWKQGGSGSSWSSTQGGGQNDSGGGGGWGSTQGSGQNDGGGGGGWGSTANKVSTGSWNKPSDETGAGGGWGQTKESNKVDESPAADSWGKAVASSWGNSSGNWKSSEPSGKNQTKESAKGKEPSADSWGNSGANNTGWGQSKESTEDKGPSDAWGKGKGAASSWGDGNSKGGLE